MRKRLVIIRAVLERGWFLWRKRYTQLTVTTHPHYWKDEPHPVVLGRPAFMWAASFIGGGRERL